MLTGSANPSSSALIASPLTSIKPSTLGATTTRGQIVTGSRVLLNTGQPSPILITSTSISTSTRPSTQTSLTPNTVSKAEAAQIVVAIGLGLAGGVVALVNIA